jgi:hypothetical protein
MGYPGFLPLPGHIKHPLRPSQQNCSQVSPDMASIFTEPYASSVSAGNKTLW